LRLDQAFRFLPAALARAAVSARSFEIFPMRHTLLFAVIAAASTTALAAEPPVLKGQAAFTDWKADAPGVRRQITPADLPPAKQGTQAEEPDMQNRAKIVARAAGATPTAPKGFTVSLLAKDLKKPRVLRVAPNGDLFIAETDGGRILVLRASEIGAGEAKPHVFAEGLTRPYGIAFYPTGSNPSFVYVGEPGRVVRFAYKSGDVAASGKAEAIVTNIPTERHWSRDLAVLPDGKIYVAVGSGSNVAGKMPEKPQAEIKTFEATHGVGATWGPEEGRGAVRVFDADGKNLKNYATGLRNCSGLGVQPGANALWCVVNERDHLGDNVPSEYATRVKANAFYGWPWYYNGGNEDPRLAGKRPDLKTRVTAPDVLMQAHTAPLGIAFYEGGMFPADYKGSAFVTMHGSWNRTAFAGYKVVRLPFANGKPTGVQEDFITGFIVNDTEAWGRPVGVAVAQDGSLLLSEDGAGTLWRVTYGTT
jgi:glucose/arabinose dehydrogenase